MSQNKKCRRLVISEIFASVQGESTHVGRPCVFVRLTGCNLRCSWCDTTYAFTDGETMTVDAVMAKVHSFGLQTVEVTGGEPLLQEAVYELMQRLVETGHRVLLETSGNRSINEVPEEVHIIMDMKAPDSGEEKSNLYANLECLRAKDEVKFVLASRRDYEWAREITLANGLNDKCTVLFASVWDQLPLQDLAKWILADKLEVRLQLQLHKVIWGPDALGV